MDRIQLDARLERSKLMKQALRVGVLIAREDSKRGRRWLDDIGLSWRLLGKEQQGGRC